MPEVNYFETLGFEEKYNLNVDVLMNRFKALQKEVHPDNFVDATEQEKRLALQYSSVINDAYANLKDPLLRAIHLLAIRGIDIKSETNTTFSQDFLMTQMEVREKLDDIKGTKNPVPLINDILKEIEHELSSGLKLLPNLLDLTEEKSLQQAAQKVRELLFYTRLKKNTKELLTQCEIV